MTNKHGIRPVQQIHLSDAAEIIIGRDGWCELVTEAEMEGSREKYIQALLVDGTVRSPDIAMKLVNELVSAQITYLPEFQQQ